VKNGAIKRHFSLHFLHCLHLLVTHFFFLKFKIFVHSDDLVCGDW